METKTAKRKLLDEITEFKSRINDENKNFIESLTNVLSNALTNAEIKELTKKLIDQII